MAEPIRFYLDEHVARAVADGLRRRGVDVLTAPEAGMHPADDTDHIALAVRERRVVFTQDADFCDYTRRVLRIAELCTCHNILPLATLCAG